VFFFASSERRSGAAAHRSSSTSATRSSRISVIRYEHREDIASWILHLTWLSPDDSAMASIVYVLMFPCSRILVPRDITRDARKISRFRDNELLGRYSWLMFIMPKAHFQCSRNFPSDLWCIQRANFQDDLKYNQQGEKENFRFNNLESRHDKRSTKKIFVNNNGHIGKQEEQT
jgi:hypothetical protein